MRACFFGGGGGGGGRGTGNQCSVFSDSWLFNDVKRMHLECVAELFESILLLDVMSFNCYDESHFPCVICFYKKNRYFIVTGKTTPFEKLLVYSIRLKNGLSKRKMYFVN